MAGIAARLARAVQECNISQSVWLALPLFRMVGLWPGFMMAMAAILGARLVLAALMRSTILAIGGVVRGGMRRQLAGAPICRRNRDADQPLDIAEVGALLVITERDRNALGACTRSAADPVNVALGDIREVVVYHVADAVDIDATGGNVGGNERAQLAVAEGCEHALALIFCDLLPWIASAE